MKDEQLIHDWINHPDQEELKKEIMGRAKKNLTAFLLILSLISISIATYVFSAAPLPNQDKLLKREVKVQILKAIQNGADLQAVQAIFNNAERYDITVFNSLKEVVGLSSDKFYQKNIALSSVLEEIRSDFFINDRESSYSNNFEPLSSDDLFLSKIDKILEEQDQKDPFDNLDDNQKFHFENVRIKLGNEYKTVQPEIERIVEELSNKNSLVSEYLNKSEQSYWISIIAILISISFSVYQIIQSRPKKMVEFFQKATMISSINTSTTPKPASDYPEE
ncbi:hypothetical protein [Jiulongibacter sp. NS-SX5]|uniref:hypothetical protein n=1 Tax=Jiulongibacter sp. NS-SX5 TaxID=3463854 RepID=UPI004059AB44